MVRVGLFSLLPVLVDTFGRSRWFCWQLRDSPTGSFASIISFGATFTYDKDAENSEELETNHGHHWAIASKPSSNETNQDLVRCSISSAHIRLYLVLCGQLFAEIWLLGWLIGPLGSETNLSVPDQCLLGIPNCHYGRFWRHWYLSFGGVHIVDHLDAFRCLSIHTDYW